MSARRLWILVCVLGVAVGLAACGQESQPTSLLNNGVYVNAGPITYQLQISRELNPFLTEDSQYVTGLPAGTAPPNANQLWYGVFLWAKNQTDRPEPTARVFEIRDSNGDRFFPLHLKTALNPYAWTPQELLPAHSQPIAGTTAFYGPTGGNLLLFKLPTTVYSNRPLTLWIFPQGSSNASHISLDL